MRWLVSNWRLKLLALVLTMGLLGAVAFSENPVTAVGVPATVDYDRQPNNLVVINPALKTTINVVGLTSQTSALRDPSLPNGIHVHVNLAGLQVPTGVRQVTLNATPKTLPAGVSWTGDPILVTVNIDKLDSRDFVMDSVSAQAIRTPKVAPGFKVLPDKTYGTCGNQSQPCSVHVIAPESLFGPPDKPRLRAYAQVDDQISGNETSPTQPVRFELDGKPFDLKTFSSIPSISVEPAVVTVVVNVLQSQVTRQVALNVNVTGQPACGYAVSSISFSPTAFVSVTGAADKIATIDHIDLPRTMDVSGATGDVRLQQNVPTDNFTSNPSAVTVTVSIQKKADCTAPTPTPLPSSSPR